MTRGRTRPTDDALEIETLVSTTSVGEQTPKLTVEQRAIAALCYEILSIAEVSARLHLPLGVIGSWSVVRRGSRIMRLILRDAPGPDSARILVHLAGLAVDRVETLAAEQQATGPTTASEGGL